MTSDEVRKLYDYNKWANRRIVECCRPIDSSAFTKNLGNSFSSLRDTLAHIIGAEWVWLERWQRRSPKKLLASEEFPDLATIETRWAEIERGQDTFLAKLTDELMGERIAYQNFKGETWTYALGAMLQHVVNHSTYHRGQVVTMVRQSGGKPLSTDYLLYFDATT